MVIAIPELFDAGEVAQMRAALAGAGWADGRATAGHRAARVKANEQLALADPVAVALGERILARLGETPLFIAATLPARVLPPRFSRYAGTGTYGSHIDAALQRQPDARDHVRCDVSATLFLADPDSYDGGELAIEDSFGVHQVKLPAGHLVIYPASGIHRVAPVTRGTRLAAFFWVQSFVRETERRRLLFDLDGAIQAIGADHPDHAGIDTLTGVYHNLLRQWSLT